MLKWVIISLIHFDKCSTILRDNSIDKIASENANIVYCPFLKNNTNGVMQGNVLSPF